MSILDKICLQAMLLSGNWTFDKMLENVRKSLIKWGAALMMIVGVAMIIVGIFKIASALISHGKTQVSWPVNIILIVVGALFCAGSTFFAKLTESQGGIGSAMVNELDALGTQ